MALSISLHCKKALARASYAAADGETRIASVYAATARTNSALAKQVLPCSTWAAADLASARLAIARSFERVRQRKLRTSITNTPRKMKHTGNVNAPQLHSVSSIGSRSMRGYCQLS